MDYRKLQETLHNIEYAKPISESRQVLENFDEVEKIKSLAGIKINEKQLKGSAGQVKGRTRVKRTSKPSRTGEQEHPFKNKLVGEKSKKPYRSLTEIFKTLDNIKNSSAYQNFQYGKQNYNKFSALSRNPTSQPSTSKTKKQTTQNQQPSATTTPSQQTAPVTPQNNTTELSGYVIDKLVPYVNNLNVALNSQQRIKKFTDDLKNLAGQSSNTVQVPRVSPRTNLPNQLKSILDPYALQLDIIFLDKRKEKKFIDNLKLYV